MRILGAYRIASNVVLRMIGQVVVQRGQVAMRVVQVVDAVQGVSLSSVIRCRIGRHVQLKRSWSTKEERKSGQLTTVQQNQLNFPNLRFSRISVIPGLSVSSSTLNFCSSESSRLKYLSTRSEIWLAMLIFSSEPSSVL